MLLRRQELWRRRSVLRRHGPWRHRGGGARTPLCWQSPWRRSSVLRCQGSWRSIYRGASAPWRRSAAVPWRPPTQGRTWPPPPLCGAKGHGAAKLICGTRVHGTVAWACPLPRWRRGGRGAMLAARGTGRHAGRLCGATNDGAAKLCCGAMARGAAKRARF